MPEVWWGFKHVHSSDLQRDGLEFGQQIEIHKIFLAEETGTFSAAINRRGLNNKFDFRNIGFAVHGWCC